MSDIKKEFENEFKKYFTYEPRTLGPAFWAAKFMAEKCAAILDEYKKAYATDLFPEPPDGEHGKTVDSCSARMGRSMADGVQKEILQIAKELSE